MHAQKTRRQKFTEVFQKNTWKGTESVSGTGSDRGQTSLLRQLLPGLLKELGATSLIDAPCGDMHWMRHVPWDALGIRYMGVDIVPELIEKLRADFPPTTTTRQFECFDIVTDVLPKADVIFCRDCLVHLPLMEVQVVLKNFARSGAAWLMTTTFPNTVENTDVRWSGWRALNLRIAPFELPAPARMLLEGCTENGGQYADKSLGVWRLADLK